MSEALRPNTAFQSDRFAREIEAILALTSAARSRRLNGRPLGRNPVASISSACFMVSSFNRLAETKE